MLWICLALLTAAVVLALAQPLARGPAKAVDAHAADMAVYRDQLLEIETERERGLIGVDDAAAARAEVARRLLQTQKPGHGANTERAPGVGSLRAVQTGLMAIPVAGMALYLALGSPGLPDQPLARRQAAPAADSPVAELVGRVEAELKKNPDDARGWSVIAPVYTNMKRYEDAAYAYSQILRLKGETPDALLSFAEAALLANKGVVNDGVKRAAERVLVLEPDRVEPKVWLALAKEQDGDIDGAVAAYKALIASAPAGAAWLGAVQDQLQRLIGSGDTKAEAAKQKPSASAIAALPEAEQQKQIAAMVDGLATRLKQNGNDLPGWQRLIRAYQVMGRNDDAQAALTSARAQFAADSKALAGIDELARSLGLTDAGTSK